MGTSSAMSTTNDKIKYKITITQNSQSVANNTSNVTVSVRVYRTNTGYTTYGTGTVYCTINGTQYTDSITSSDKITSSGIVLFSKTLNISHNADGTKTLATSARITHDQFSSSSQSYSQALTTIPRATTPTVSAKSVNMGASITINMSRASSSFDHTLTYKFGSATGTIGSDLGTSKAWTVPLSLASQIPNGTSGTCTITCKTYNGSTLIGTKTVSFTATVPSSVVPTIGSVAVADTNTAYAAQLGSLVQNKSKAKFTITASGAYGSTIKTYKTVIEGKTYTGATPTTSILTGSGNVNATITVTDSRGRTASTTKTFYRIPYTAPIITVFDAVRTDAEGVENYEGTSAKVSIAFNIAAASNKNTSSYKIEYKKQSETTWTALTSGTGYTHNNSIITEALFNIDYAYDIKLTVADYFTTLTRTISLPTAFTLIDYNANGRAMAFGKVSEVEEGIEFALPTFFSHAETPSSMIYLQGGEDFNDILEPGFYCIPTTAVSGTLVNKPWSGTATGGLIVLREGDGLGKCQIAHKLSKDDGAIYERSYYQSAWGDWQCVHDGKGKILWTGGMYMTSGHIISFSEPASKQPSGIVLVFSEYYDGEVKNQSFASFFVPRRLIESHSGSGHCFWMSTSNVAYIATKYLYIRDDGITGHNNNSLTLTGSGVTLNNNRFVLRYVLGV